MCKGVSTRKVKRVAEQLCGHRFSASAVSRLNQSLDEELERFAQRRLESHYPYLILDARYERVRENAVIQKQAVLVAIGISWDGRREVLGVELANRESHSSWKEFLIGLKERGLAGVRLAISDNHEGLKRLSSRRYRNRTGNVVTFIFLEMRWIIYRRKPMMML